MNDWLLVEPLSEIDAMFRTSLLTIAAIWILFSAGEIAGKTLFDGYPGIDPCSFHVTGTAQGGVWVLDCDSLVCAEPGQSGTACYHKVGDPAWCACTDQAPTGCTVYIVEDEEGASLAICSGSCLPGDDCQDTGTLMPPTITCRCQ